MTDALVEQGQAVGLRLAGDLDDVFLFELVARVAQSSNHLALLAEHQQAAHVRLQRQQLGMTSEVPLQGCDPGRILRPASGLAQHVLNAGGIDGRRLSGCLVHQQGHGRCFDCKGAGQQLDTLRLNLEIRGFDSLSVDLDPAAFDIEFGLTPGAAHQFGKAFGQADRLGHVQLGRREKASEPRRRVAPCSSLKRRVTSC